MYLLRFLGNKILLHICKHNLSQIYSSKSYILKVMLDCYTMFSNNLFPWFYLCNFIYILISESLYYIYLFMMHYISTITIFSLRCKLFPSFKSNCRYSQLPDANLLALHFYDKQGVQYKYFFRVLLSNIILFEQNVNRYSFCICLSIFQSLGA